MADLRDQTSLPSPAESRVLMGEGSRHENQGDSAYNDKYWSSFCNPTASTAEVSEAMDDFGRNLHIVADSRSPWSPTAPIPVDGYTQIQAESQAPSDGANSAEVTRRNTSPNLYDQWLLIPQQAPSIGPEEPANHPSHWNSSAVPAQRGVMNSVVEDGTVDPRALDLRSRGRTW